MKLFESKRIKFAGIHLYRLPRGLASTQFLVTATDGKYRLTWDEWENRISKLCPFQHWFREEFYYNCKFSFRRLKDRWYKVKCFFSPYNVLHLHKLPKTWSDEAEMLPHAIFAVVERFMSENPAVTVDYPGSGEEHEKFWSEINKAWQWWLDAPKRQAQLDAAWELIHGRYYGTYEVKYKEVNELEEKLEKEETEMCMLVVKWRKYMWV